MTEIIVRQLTQNDISTADRIYRLAFGTFVGLHDPIQSEDDSGRATTLSCLAMKRFISYIFGFIISSDQREEGIGGRLSSVLLILGGPIQLVLEIYIFVERIYCGLGLFHHNGHRRYHRYTHLL